MMNKSRPSNLIKKINLEADEMLIKTFKGKKYKYINFLLHLLLD